MNQTSYNVSKNIENEPLIVSKIICLKTKDNEKRKESLIEILNVTNQPFETIQHFNFTASLGVFIRSGMQKKATDFYQVVYKI